MIWSRFVYQRYIGSNTHEANARWRVTTPAERTRAAIQVRRFLAWVASNCKHDYWMVPPSGSVPRKVREEADRLLRHYPMPVDLVDPGRFDVAEVKAHYDPPWEKTQPKLPGFS